MMIKRSEIVNSSLEVSKSFTSPISIRSAIHICAHFLSFKEVGFLNRFFRCVFDKNFVWWCLITFKVRFIASLFNVNWLKNIISIFAFHWISVNRIALTAIFFIGFFHFWFRLCLQIIIPFYFFFCNLSYILVILFSLLRNFISTFFFSFLTHSYRIWLNMTRTLTFLKWCFIHHMWALGFVWMNSFHLVNINFLRSFDVLKDFSWTSASWFIISIWSFIKYFWSDFGFKGAKSGRSLRGVIFDNIWALLKYSFSALRHTWLNLLWLFFFWKIIYFYVNVLVEIKI